MNQKAYNNDPILRQIVNRCHVGESYDDVFNYAVSRLTVGVWDKMPVKEQERFKKACIYLHDKNKNLYNCVMGGIG